MKILIAEDDHVSGLFLRRTLEKLNHEVDIAKNGQEAWEQYQKETYQMVISDWMMPAMDGLELCRTIRAKRSSAYLYFILLTDRKSVV